ncbi:hypothetical protein M0813_03308 [Anaeramoeba flamelloides]|uniref:Separase n=1 Tax=Anaeramoeba flamelloides TaxID=1746091 RepID=A0ABQ8Y0H1_9EUKA|nr:hypothetical protein M0813_03308 [Anaeramoeba flamelloides]
MSSNKISELSKFIDLDDSDDFSFEDSNILSPTQNLQAQFTTTSNSTTQSLDQISGSGSDWDEDFNFGSDEDSSNLSFPETPTPKKTNKVKITNFNSLQENQKNKKGFFEEKENEEENEEEEEENWDKEFEDKEGALLTPKPKLAQMFRGLLDESESEEDPDSEEFIPEEYLIEPNECNKELLKNKNKQILSSSSQFISQGIQEMDKNIFLVWLGSLISQHTTGWKTSMSQLSNQKKLQYSISQVRIWTQEWSLYFLEHLTAFKYNQMNSYLKKYTDHYFTEINNFLIEINKDNIRERFEQFELDEIERMFEISLDIFKFYNPLQGMENVYRYADILKKLCPHNFLKVDLICLEHLIENCQKFDATIILKILKEFLRIYQSVGGVFQGKKFNDLTDEKSLSNYYICLMVLTDLELHNLGFNLLTINNKDNKKKLTIFDLYQDNWVDLENNFTYDKNKNKEKQKNKKNTNNNNVDYDDDDNDEDEDDEEEDDDDDYEKKENDFDEKKLKTMIRSISSMMDLSIFRDEFFRVELIKKLYQIIPNQKKYFSIKAKTAFLLGYYHHEIMKENNQGENYLYECLYLLDLSGKKYHQDQKISVPIISNLSIMAFLEYAEVLSINKKYKYSIICYESVVKINELMKLKTHHSIFRKLAETCQKNLEYLKSLNYYLIILEEFKKNKKNNEIIYVSEVISSIFLERGEFIAAEEYLKQAALFIDLINRDSNLSNSFKKNERINSNNNQKNNLRLSSRYINCQLKIVKVYLKGVNIERAIILLNDLLDTRLSNRQRVQFLELLIQAYLKKRWLKESMEELINLEKLLTIIQNNSNNKKKIDSNVNNNSNTNNSGNNLKEKYFNLSKNLSFIELNCKICYHSGQIGDALYWANCLLDLIHEDNVGSKGRYLYLKAKCLQRLCNPKTLHKFPLIIRLSFDPNKETRFGNPIPLPKYNIRTFSSIGDLVNETIELCLESSNYFEKAGNKYKKNIVLTSLVETLLEYHFPLVALLNYDFNEVGRIPRYESRLLNNHQNVSSHQKVNKKSTTDINYGFNFTLDNIYEHIENNNTEKILSLNKLEEITELNLDLNTEYLHPLILLRNYLNYSEVSFLLGNNKRSKLYFEQCKNYFWKMFMSGGKCLLNEKIHCSFLEKLSLILKRLVRLLFSFETDYINKNLIVIEGFLSFENLIDLSRSVRIDSIEAIFGENSESKKSLEKRKKRKKQHLTKIQQNSKKSRRRRNSLSSSSSNFTKLSIRKASSSKKNTHLKMAKKPSIDLQYEKNKIIHEKNKFKIQKRFRSNSTHKKKTKYPSGLKSKFANKAIINQQQLNGTSEGGSGNSQILNFNIDPNSIKITKNKKDLWRKSIRDLETSQLNNENNNDNENNTTGNNNDNNNNNNENGNYQNQNEKKENEYVLNSKLKQQSLCEKVWSILYRINLNFKEENFLKNLKEIRKNNQKLILKLFKLNQEYLNKKKITQNFFEKNRSTSMFSKKLSIDFNKNLEIEHPALYGKNLLKFQPQLKKLIYILLIQDLIILYSPVKERKKIFSMGGVRLTEIIKKKGLNKLQKNKNTSILFSPTSYNDLENYFTLLNDHNKNMKSINHTNDNDRTVVDGSNNNETFKNISLNLFEYSESHNIEINTKELMTKGQFQFIGIIKNHSYLSLSEMKLLQSIINQHQGNENENNASIDFQNIFFSKNTFKFPQSFFNKSQKKNQNEKNGQGEVEVEDEVEDEGRDVDNGDDREKEVEKIESGGKKGSELPPKLPPKLSSEKKQQILSRIKPKLPPRSPNKPTPNSSTIHLFLQDSKKLPPKLPPKLSPRLPPKKSLLHSPPKSPPKSPLKLPPQLPPKLPEKSPPQLPPKPPLKSPPKLPPKLSKEKQTEILLKLSNKSKNDNEKIINKNNPKLVINIPNNNIKNVDQNSSSRRGGSGRSSSSRRSIQKNMEIASKKNKKKLPIILIMSKWLQIFPWEQMFDSTVIRSQDLLHSIFLPKSNTKLMKFKKKFEKKRGFKKKLLNLIPLIPKFFAMYSPPEIARQVSEQELTKKRIIYSQLKFELNHSKDLYISGREIQNTPPFHTPLVKFGKFPNKSKYKYFSYIETQLFSESPQRLSFLIQKILKINEYPVLFLSYLDFLKISYSISYLLFSKYNYSFLLVQERHMIQVAKFLKDEINYYIKICKKAKIFGDLREFLLNTTTKIRNDLHIPISFYSPPSSNIKNAIK